MRRQGARLGGKTMIFAVLLALQAWAAPWEDADSGKPPSQTAPALPQTPSSGTMPGQGLQVEDIQFPGVPNEAERKQLQELIPQKTGQPLDRESIRQSMKLLYGTGRFADIRAESETTPDGRVKLSFVTASNYFIGQVQVDGAPNRPSANQVVNSTKLELGAPFTPEGLERALKNIKQLMEENGYFLAAVQEEQQPHPDTQQVDIIFHLTPGAQATVGQVKVTGNPSYSQGQIQDMAHFHPGDYVSAQRVSDALGRLRKKFQKQKRLLAQVTVTERAYQPQSNTVNYTFDVQPGPTVEIVTEGFKISKSVVKRNVPIFEENALDDDLLNEGRRNLLNHMQTQGYFNAKVSYRKRNPRGAAVYRVLYTIDPGERHKLVKVNVTGNNIFPTEEILSRLQIQPAGRFLSHGKFSQALLNEDIRNIQANPYLANGFSQIKITPKVEDNYEGKANQLAVTLVIEEGPQVRVGSVQIVGNARIPAGQLTRSMSTSEGQAFSDSTIAQDREVILNTYFDGGFPDATLDVSAKPAGEPNQMDVTFTIHEGQQRFVNRVLVDGLHYTRDFVVRRELQMNTGDPLSQIAMLKTQQHLYNLGLFSVVDTAVQNPEGAEPNKNVLVQVQEAKRYTFNYGFGIEFQTGQPTANTPQGDTGVSPRISFGVTRLNFRGRNHTLNFKSNLGRLQQRALVSSDIPRWFSSPDWKLSVTAFFDRTIDVTTFTSQRLEGSLQAQQTLKKKQDDTIITSLIYNFTYRLVKATNLSNTITPDEIPLLSQPVRVGAPGISYLNNTRDNDLESTKGSYTTIDLSVASEYFGSQESFSRILAQNATYYAFGKNRQPGKKFVFARSLRIGLENPFGNTVAPIPGQNQSSHVIPLPELFLAGGGNSHRGFGLNQAGPRDPTTGFPLGGTAMFVNNLELRMPPVSLPFVGENISLAIFHDAGNVFSTGRGMLNNLLRWKQKDPQLCELQATATQCDYNYISHAIGVGLRYKTPIGPVRFDFGYNLNPPRYPSQTKDPNDPNAPPVFVPQQARHFNVFFSIGQTF